MTTTQQVGEPNIQSIETELTGLCGRIEEGSSQVTGEMDLPRPRRCGHLIRKVRLQKTEVHARILPDFCCDVQLTQTFCPVQDVLASKYRFPLPSTAAIYSFEATFPDGTKVVAQIKEKHEAKLEYNEAVSSGKQAFLLEEKNSLKDVFEISCGNLKANEAVQVSLAYVSELDVLSDVTQFVFPRSIGPRYGQKYYENPRLLQYPLKVSLEVFGQTNIVDVDMQATNKYAYNTTKDIKNNQGKVVVEFAPTYGLAADLVFDVKQERVPPVVAMIEADEQFRTEALRLSVRKSVAKSTTEPRLLVIFLIDKSGSMSGSRMKSVKDCMKIFLRSLPEGSYFQLMSFNRSVQKCTSEPREYNQNSLVEAQNWVNRMNASGGTNIFDSLQAAFESHPPEGYQKNVILLTDGEVNNTTACIQRTRENQSNARVFTIGIGASFSEGLCRGIAEAGNGSFEGVRDPKNSASTVVRMLAAMEAGFISDFKVDLGAWGKGMIEQYPNKVEHIFPGKRTSIYWSKSLQLEGEEGSYKAPDKFMAKLTGTYSNGEKLNMEVFVNLSPIPYEGHIDATRKYNKSVHRLMAKKMISQLEADTKFSTRQVRKTRIIELSKKYNIMTSETSFIGIRHETEGSQEGTTTTVPNISWEPKVEPVRMSSSNDYAMNSFSPMCAYKSSSHSRGKKKKSARSIPNRSMKSMKKSIQPQMMSLGSSSSSGFYADISRSCQRKSAPRRRTSSKQTTRSISNHTQEDLLPRRRAPQVHYSAMSRDSPELYCPPPQAACRPSPQSERIAMDFLPQMQESFLCDQQSDDDDHFQSVIPQAPPITLAKARSSPPMPYLSLIDAQEFDGHFNLPTKAFVEERDMAEKVLQILQSIDPKLDQTIRIAVFQTALAIYTLHKYFQDKQSEWVLMEKKAKRFITKNVEQSKASELLSAVLN